MGRWLASLTAIIIIGIALLLVKKTFFYDKNFPIFQFLKKITFFPPQIPRSTSFDQLIIPMGLIGFAIGMVGK